MMVAFLMALTVSGINGDDNVDGSYLNSRKKNYPSIYPSIIIIYTIQL